MSITINEKITTIEHVESRQDTHPLHHALLTFKKSAIDLKSLQPFKITRIECFRYDYELVEKLQLGNGTDDICGLLAISTDAGAVGFREFAIPSSSLKCDLTAWVALFQRIKGLTLIESMNYAQLKQETWGPVRLDLIESVLLDLIGKIEPTLQAYKDQTYILDRAYLFDHAQAYISF